MGASRSGIPSNETVVQRPRLVSAVATYLPACLVQRRLNNGSESAVTGEQVVGALLFADISGFTTLSEQLANRGKEGAEELTVLLNEYFECMVNIVSEHGGDVLQFGGDSLLALFPTAWASGGEGAADGPYNGSAPAAHVLQAVRCGLSMQRAMARFDQLHTSAGTFGLSMSIGIHRGEFLLASAGWWEGRLQQVMTGRALNQLAEVEALAEPGEVLVSAAAKEVLANHVQWGAARENNYPVAALRHNDLSSHPAGGPAAGGPWELDRIDAESALAMLRPYLIPAVYRRIVDDPAGYSNEGEHRFIATMFVHFTDVNAAVDHFAADHPRDVVRFLDAYLAEMTETITRHGGALARVSADRKGDKLLVLFGAPVGVEKPEQRALRCALEMNRRLEEWNAKSPVAFEHRIGITCGNAFCGNVGSDRRREYTVIGDQVNIAARLMSRAEAAEILASRDVWQKTRTAFRFKSRGPVTLKGKRQAQDVYQLLSPRPRRSGPRPRVLVGRQSQRQTLHDTAQRVCAGSGEVLVVCGDAGVGKSLLVNDFAAHCRDRGMRGLWGHCHSYGHSIPYLPWAEIFRSIADIHRHDAVEVCRQKLAAALGAADRELAAWAPLLGTVVGAPIPDNSRTAALAPRQRKEKIFAVCRELLATWARQGPALLVLEDIHWIDPLSRELLVFLASATVDNPLLFLATHRSDFEPPPWDAAVRASQIELGLLSQDSTLEMLEQLLGTKAVPDGLAALVLDKTQGNPFYVEEMLHALREAKLLVWNPASTSYELTRDAKTFDLPETIQGLILSRLDRLPEEQRRILQVASVFGRTFAGDVLQAVLPFSLTPGALASKLQEVARLDLIDSEPAPPSPSYAFRHAMVQEVAYESLSYARRREIHRAIGEELERANGGDFAEQCDVLARHFDLGRAADKAIEYLVMAGDKAKGAYANAEAADYYERALGHVRGADSTASPQLLVRLLEDLGDVHSLTGDYPAALERYQECLQSAEAPVKRARLEGKLGGVCYRQGQPHAGIEHLENGLRHLGIHAPRTKWRVRASLLTQLLTQASHTLLPRLFVRRRSRHRASVSAAIEIYEALSRISFECDLEKTLDAHLRQLNLCETISGSPEMAQTYSSHGIVCGVIPSFSRAVRYQQKGLAIREAERDRWGVAQSLNFMGISYYWMSDWEQARTCLEQSVRIFTEVGDRWETEVTYLILAFICLRKGELEEALRHAQTCLDLSRQAQDYQGMGWALGALAEIHNRQGHLQQALVHGRQALDCSEQARDHMYLSVIWRVLGEIQLSLGDPQQAVVEMQRSMRQIREYGLRHEFVVGAYPGLAESYLAALDGAANQDDAAKRACLKETGQLCRQAVRRARRFRNWLGYAYRVSARYEWTRGRRDAARRCFQRSLDSSQSLGARYEMGRTCYELGRFLRDARDPEADDYLEQAARLFQQCGATLDQEHAEALTANPQLRIDRGEPSRHEVCSVNLQTEQEPPHPGRVG